MYAKLLEKMKTDAYIIQALKAKHKKTRKSLLIYAAVVFLFAIVLCFSAKWGELGWFIALFCAAIATLLPLCFLHYKKSEPKIFCGNITRMEEDRKIVPQKGTGAFGRGQLRTTEVYELLVAITNEKGETQVIFCPPQYEKICKVGDTLLCHSALPYPAHLSNPTTCICMHCGTMQASENTTCITCKAKIYSLHTSKQ